MTITNPIVEGREDKTTLPQDANSLGPVVNGNLNGGPLVESARGALLNGKTNAASSTPLEDDLGRFQSKLQSDCSSVTSFLKRFPNGGSLNSRIVEQSFSSLEELGNILREIRKQIIETGALPGNITDLSASFVKKHQELLARLGNATNEVSGDLGAIADLAPKEIKKKVDKLNKFIDKIENKASELFTALEGLISESVGTPETPPRLPDSPAGARLESASIKLASGNPAGNGQVISAAVKKDRANATPEGVQPVSLGVRAEIEKEKELNGDLRRHDAIIEDIFRDEKLRLSDRANGAKLREDTLRMAFNEPFQALSEMFKCVTFLERPKPDFVAGRDEVFRIYTEAKEKFEGLINTCRDQYPKLIQFHPTKKPGGKEEKEKLVATKIEQVLGIFGKRAKEIDTKMQTLVGKKVVQPETPPQEQASAQLPSKEAPTKASVVEEPKPIAAKPQTPASGRSSVVKGWKPVTAPSQRPASETRTPLVGWRKLAGISDTPTPAPSETPTELKLREGIEQKNYSVVAQALEESFKEFASLEQEARRGLPEGRGRRRLALENLIDFNVGERRDITSKVIGSITKELRAEQVRIQSAGASGGEIGADESQARINTLMRDNAWIYAVVGRYIESLNYRQFERDHDKIKHSLNAVLKFQVGGLQEEVVDIKHAKGEIHRKLNGELIDDPIRKEAYTRALNLIDSISREVVGPTIHETAQSFVAELGRDDLKGEKIIERLHQVASKYWGNPLRGLERGIVVGICKELNERKESLEQKVTISAGHDISLEGDSEAVRALRAELETTQRNLAYVEGLCNGHLDAHRVMEKGKGLRPSDVSFSENRIQGKGEIRYGHSDKRKSESVVYGDWRSEIAKLLESAAPEEKPTYQKAAKFLEALSGHVRSRIETYNKNRPAQVAKPAEPAKLPRAAAEPAKVLKTNPMVATAAIASSPEVSSGGSNMSGPGTTSGPKTVPTDDLRKEQSPGTPAAESGAFGDTLKKIGQEFAAKDKENAELRLKIDEVQDHIIDLDKANEERDRKNSELEQKLEKIIKENQQLASDIKAATARNQELEATMGELTKELLAWAASGKEFPPAVMAHLAKRIDPSAAADRTGDAKTVADGADAAAKNVDTDATKPEALVDLKTSATDPVAAAPVAPTATPAGGTTAGTTTALVQPPPAANPPAATGGPTPTPPNGAAVVVPVQQPAFLPELTIGKTQKTSGVKISFELQEDTTGGVTQEYFGKVKVLDITSNSTAIYQIDSTVPLSEVKKWQQRLQRPFVSEKTLDNFAYWLRDKSDIPPELRIEEPRVAGDRDFRVRLADAARRFNRKVETEQRDAAKKLGPFAGVDEYTLKRSIEARQVRVVPLDKQSISDTDILKARQSILIEEPMWDSHEWQDVEITKDLEGYSATLISPDDPTPRGTRRFSWLRPNPHEPTIVKFRLADDLDNDPNKLVDVASKLFEDLSNDHVPHTSGGSLLSDSEFVINIIKSHQSIEIKNGIVAHANWLGQDLSGVTFENVEFRDCDLRELKALGARFKDCRFIRCQLDNAQFGSGDLTKAAVFDGCYMDKYTTATNGDWRNVLITNITHKGTGFHCNAMGTDLGGLRIEPATLTESQFRRAWDGFKFTAEMVDKGSMLSKPSVSYDLGDKQVKKILDKVGHSSENIIQELKGSKFIETESDTTPLTAKEKADPRNKGAFEVLEIKKKDDDLDYGIQWFNCGKESFLRYIDKNGKWEVTEKESNFVILHRLALIRAGQEDAAKNYSPSSGTASQVGVNQNAALGGIPTQRNNNQP